MSEWKEYKLGETLVSANTGLDAIKRAPIVSHDTGIKCLRIQDISQSKKYKDWGFTEVLENNFTKFKLLANDIIVARTGATVGVNMIIQNNLNSVFNNGLIRLRAKNEFDSRYIYYLLKSSDYWNHISSIAFGTTSQPNIQINQLLDFKIKAPTQKHLQTTIAEILSSLDDKIELNNKINQELETLAQTLFKQWFIDFEFPNENGEPYKSSGGEMVESELGEIPKGWEVKTLNDVSNITIGRTPPRQENQWFSKDVKDVKWISIRDMGNCGTYIHTTSEFLTEDAVSHFNVPVINSNTVIISFKLTVGRISITTERMLSNEAIAHLNLKNSELYPEFLYLFLKQFNFDSLGSTSSIATAVNSKSIKSLPFIYPSKEILSRFKYVLVPIFSRIHNLTFENKEIINLRDELLPKLISGELEINEITN
jgi:type I restriction enzyme S subunit